MNEKQVLEFFSHRYQKISDYNSLKRILTHIEYVGKHHDDYLEHNAKLFSDAFTHLISTGRMAAYVETLLYGRTIKWLVKLVVENEVTCQYDACKAIGKKIQNLTGKRK